MDRNITLKGIEEIILSKQERHSRYISTMNSFFENIYNRYKNHYANNETDKFNDIVANIAEVMMIPDTSFEHQNLFLIKKLILRILDKKLCEKSFYSSQNIEDLFNIEIDFEKWDDEEYPKLKININRTEFTIRFNKWYNSPIFVDENGKICLFDTFGDKRFGLDKEYFDKLDSAKLGTYLQEFSITWDKLAYRCRVIEDNLNNY